MKTYNHYITLKKVRFYAYHGLLEHEKKVGNVFQITLKIHFNANDVMTTADLRQGINYAEVHQLLQEEMNTPIELLEVLAIKILRKLGKSFPTITRAKLTITKVNPPISKFEGEGISFTTSADY